MSKKAKVNNKEIIIANRGNFTVGETYTLKEMCANGGIKYVSGGNAKKTLINVIYEVFDIEESKKGNATVYKIVGVKDLSEQELADLTQVNTGSNGKFTDDLQIVILSILAQNHRGEVAFSKGKLFEKTNLTNCNYREAKYNIPKLSALLDVDKDICYDFFNDSQSKMVGYVETALNRLYQKRLAIWEKVIMVCKVETVTNALGEAKILGVSEDNLYGSGKVSYGKTHRVATQLEKQFILKTEHEIMTDMGFNDVQSIYLSGKWREFKTRVNKILLDQINVMYSYDGYLLTYNHDIVMRALQDEQTVEFAKSNINCNMVDTMVENANNRNTNALNKVRCIVDTIELYTDEELKGMSIYARDKVAIKDNYVEDRLTITNAVINTNIKKIDFSSIDANKL